MAQIEIKGIIGEEYTFSNFLTDFEKAGIEPIRLVIDSIGGNVSEGMEIANFIQSKEERFVSVSNSGDVASIATPIFLALQRQKRFFDLSKGVFLIHNPFLDPFSLSFTSDTTAEGLSMIVSELEAVENDLSKFYVKQTGADMDVVRSLMKINQPLTEDQLVALNIATVYQYQAVAILTHKKEMDTNEVKAIVQEEHKTLLDGIKAWFKKTTRFVAIMLTDATGAQVEFPDVAEGNDPQVGDTAKMADGSPVPAELVMADGSTFKFENGVLMEIVPAEPAETEVEIQVDPNAERIAELEAELATLKGAKAEADTVKAKLQTKDAEIFALKAQIKSQMPTTEAVEAPAQPSTESPFMQAAKKVKGQIIN